MYNFVVVYEPNEWDGSPTVFPYIRFFEYTAEAIKERFRSLDDKAIEELGSIPTLFAYETGNNLDARIGRIKAVRIRKPDVRIEYELDAALPPIPHKNLSDLVWELGSGLID